jgi:hypothetical protein
MGKNKRGKQAKKKISVPAGTTTTGAPSRDPDDGMEALANAIASVFNLSDDSDTMSYLTSMLDTASGGEIPRSIFDKHMVSDVHAWCVDEVGNVCDYPDEQNQHGEKKTKNIIRRPWDAYMVAKALPHIDEYNSEIFFSKHTDVTNEEWLLKIRSNTFPTKHCYARAKILRDSNPKKYALVIGSLGYKQNDGSIFWEFG